MQLEQVFYQESDQEVIKAPVVRTPDVYEDPKIVYREIVYQYKVTCWYSRKLNIGIIQIELTASPSFVSDKGYTEKHLSEYPTSAQAIRDAIRLFDEAVAEGLPDQGKTEEDAWEEWRESQNPKPKCDAPKIKKDPSLEETIAEIIGTIQAWFPELNKEESQFVVAELLRNRFEFDRPTSEKIVNTLPPPF